MIAPLEDFLVLDMTQGESGPFCAMQLGDIGADVIKIEPLEGDWSRRLGPPFVDGDSSLFLGLNRNKRSIALDLAHPRGKEIIRKLATRADVFIESFRPGVIDSMGLGYEALNRINPRLVYCSISAYDQTGPYAKRASGDLVLQGMAGIHKFLGIVGRDPVKIGFNFASVVADMYACQAIAAALFWRFRSGLGQKVETSMLRAMLCSENNSILSDNNPDPPSASASSTGQMAPPATGYKTKDLPVMFSFSMAREEQAWQRFCRSVGISDEVTNNPRYATEQLRQQHEEELRPIYEESFKNKSAAEVLKLLEAVDAICAPHHTYQTLFADPNILAEETLLEVDHATAGKMNTVGLIWKLTETPGSVRLAPPKVGQYTYEILASIGYSHDSIAELEKSGVIKGWRPSKKHR